MPTKRTLNLFQKKPDLDLFQELLKNLLITGKKGKKRARNFLNLLEKFLKKSGSK